jgi:CBS domain-containing protein
MYSTVTVKQILDRKGTDVWSIPPNYFVLQALQYMAEKNIGAVMVTEGKDLVGVFSERDYARKVVIAGKNETETMVMDVMTSRVIGVGMHQKIEECLALMTGKFIRHLPVVDNDGQLQGVISIGDVVKELIVEQGFVIDQLVNYVTGEMPIPPIPDKSEPTF